MYERLSPRRGSGAMAAWKPGAHAAWLHTFAPWAIRDGAPGETGVFCACRFCRNGVFQRIPPSGGVGNQKTGAKLGSTRTKLGSSGAKLGSTGTKLGLSGAELGSSGAKLGSSGANHGSTEAKLGLAGANHGSTEAKLGLAGTKLGSSAARHGSTNANLVSTRATRANPPRAHSLVRESLLAPALKSQSQGQTLRAHPNSARYADENDDRRGLYAYRSGLYAHRAGLHGRREGMRYR